MLNANSRAATSNPSGRLLADSRTFWSPCCTFSALGRSATFCTIGSRRRLMSVWSDWTMLPFDFAIARRTSRERTFVVPSQIGKTWNKYSHTEFYLFILTVNKTPSKSLKNLKLVSYTALDWARWDECFCKNCMFQYNLYKYFICTYISIQEV